MLTFAWLLIAIGFPLVTAVFLAQMLRVPEHTKRIAAVLYVVLVAACGLYPLSRAFRPGIDLSGGTILVYQVQQPAPKDLDINKMVGVIQRRINPAGLLDASVRAVGRDQVEIVIPRAKQEDVARCKQILTSSGSLEFRILANRRDHGPLADEAEATFPQPVVERGTTLARWLPVSKTGESLGTQGEILVRRTPEQGTMALIVMDPYNVTGELLSRANSTADEMTRPAVGFHFGHDGAQRFGQLTQANSPDSDGFERRLAIVLDGEIYSAPGIRTRIERDGIITGEFSPTQVDDLVSVLNAGSLPASLDRTPASESSIGPTLGRDTIQSGVTAMAISTVAVLVFMVVYYRLAGLVADLAVLLNTLIVIGFMSWVHASWTLAGLAGLALSVGMAVDANVLIFERLREEQQKVASLRMAIRNAFDRALRPILDSNITTMLASVVLYWIGSEQIKGFALTLLIGLVANLFTAVFVCRLVFDVLETNHWVRQFHMTQLFRKTTIDFAGKRWLAVTGSALLILVGGLAVAARRANMLDIDFTGGTLAAMTLQQPTDSAVVRQRAGAVLPAVAVEELQLGNEPEGTHFLVRTTLRDQGAVKAGLTEAFATDLVATRMRWESLEPLETPAGPSPVGASPTPAASKTAARADTTAKAATGSRATLEFSRSISAAAIRTPIDDFLTHHGYLPAAQYYHLKPVGDTPGSEFTRCILETRIPVEPTRQLLDHTRSQLMQTTAFQRLDNFGGQVAAQAQTSAGLALVASMLAIVIYLWIRFQNVLFGLGAVVAVVHDVLIVLGLVALSAWIAPTWLGHQLGIDAFQISLPMVAALLTLIGYSVNDTIVVFDRIREIRRRSQPVTWGMINLAVNQTLSRTVLTGFTTWLVAVLLFTLGGPAIHGFAFCLVAGVLVGTYSSVFVASPVLIWFSRLSPDRPAASSGGLSAADHELAASEPASRVPPPDGAHPGEAAGGQGGKRGSGTSPARRQGRPRGRVSKGLQGGEGIDKLTN